MHLDRSTISLTAGGLVASVLLVAASYALPVEAAATDRPRCERSAEVCRR